MTKKMPLEIMSVSEDGTTCIAWNNTILEFYYSGWLREELVCTNIRLGQSTTPRDIHAPYVVSNRVPSLVKKQARGMAYIAMRRRAKMLM